MNTTSFPNGFAVVFFSVAYTVQGVILAFLFTTIPMLIIEQVSYFQLGVLSISILPYIFKPFIGALMPYRGVLWIMIGTIGIIGLGFLVGSETIKDAIQSANLVLLCFGCFQLSLLLTFHDIMLYPWMKSLLSQTMVSAIHTLGLNLGIMISFILVWVSKEPSGVIDLSLMLRVLGGVCIAIGFGIIILWKLGYGVPLGVLHETGLVALFSTLQIELSKNPIRSLVLLGLLQHLPFLAIEVLMPWKLLEKGVPIGIIISIKIFDIILGVTSGAIVWHWVRKSQLMNLWMICFVFQCGFGVGHVLLLSTFPDRFAVFDHFAYLIAYIVVHEAFVFTKNLQLTSQTLIYNEIMMEIDVELKKTMVWWLNGFQELGSHLPRILIYCFNDLLTEWVCFRQNQEFSDVPCPKGKSLAATSNLCTDAGGECRAVFDGFYPLSISSLVLSIPLGLFFYRTLKSHKYKLKKEN